MLITVLFQRGQYSYKIITLIFMLILIFPPSAFSHGGGLDSSGCHHDRKRGGYHCHRSSYTPPVTSSYNSLYSSFQKGGGSSNGFGSTSSYSAGNISPLNTATVTNTGQSEEGAKLEKLLFEQANKIKELESTIAELKNKEAEAVRSCKEIDKEAASIAQKVEPKAKEILPDIEPIPNSNEKFKVRVKTIRSNIRRQPVLGGNIIGTVAKGDVLSVIGENTNFYLVSTSGGKAYIHKTTVESLDSDTSTDNPINQKISAVYDPLQGISHSDKSIIEIACSGKWINGIGEYKNCLQEQRKQLDDFSKQN